MLEPALRRHDFASFNLQIDVSEPCNIRIKHLNLMFPSYKTFDKNIMITLIVISKRILR